jgi:hypothetical protein
MYPIIHDKIAQGTPEWHVLRAGKVTGTTAKKILVPGKYDFGFGKGAITEAKRLANQLVSKQVLPDDEAWKGKAVARGKFLEHEARKKYSVTTFQTVRVVAFVEASPRHGYSPDGLVYDDGLIEIKCYTNSDKHDDALNGINNDHEVQIQWGLFCTGRKWCDYVSYYPELPEERQLAIKRYHPNKFMFEIFKQKLELFNRLVDSMVENKKGFYHLTH